LFWFPLLEIIRRFVKGFFEIYKIWSLAKGISKIYKLLLQTNNKMIQKQVIWPKLNTVIMVENTIKNSTESLMTIPELKRSLPKQINHNILKLILRYLEESNKILTTTNGITWIHNINKNLKQFIADGFEI